MEIASVVKDVIEENPHMAVLIIDRNGTVKFINDTYLKVLNLPRNMVLGKDIRQITPETRLPSGGNRKTDSGI
jgi:transcriptional regulator with PAS, ATPase and Fis domain